MAKIIKAKKWEYSAEELEMMYETAALRGGEAVKTEKQAQSVRYDHATHRIILELKNGITMLLPCDLMQGIADALPVEIAEVELGARRASLHWEKLDQDFSVNGLVNGIFGTQKWMENLITKNLNLSNSTIAETHRQAGTDQKKVA